jgi:ADP-ribosyl-[dinitrogen reductase] hydrolase
VKLTERELNRGRGAWLGQIVGDALGTTLEFRPAGSIEREYPNGLREIVGGGPFRVLPGQVTDDTELALALARSIIEHGGYDADRVAYAYLAWYRSGPFDVGGTTSQAFGGAVEPGRAVAEQLTRRANRKSESNGSLMRASPLGIYGWKLPEIELAYLAATDSSLSHPAAACVAACVVHTYAIGYAIRTGHKPIAVYERRWTLPAGAPGPPSSSWRKRPEGCPTTSTPNRDGYGRHSRTPSTSYSTDRPSRSRSSAR